MQAKDIASEFPDPRSADYYNTAGSSLCPVTVRDQAKQYVEDSCADIVAARKKYLPRLEALRRLLAELLGCCWQNHMNHGDSVGPFGFDGSNHPLTAVHLRTIQRLGGLIPLRCQHEYSM